MKIEPDEQPLNYIKQYQETEITIAGVKYSLPVMVAANYIQETDNAIFTQLQISEYLKLAEKNFEIIVVGTGMQQQWPAKEIHNKIPELKCSFEFMNNVSAINTFNLLLSDNRNVLLILTC